MSVLEVGFCAADLPMIAPAIWATNMDLGLLMVMCPVLKSCKVWNG